MSTQTRKELFEKRRKIQEAKKKYLSDVRTKTKKFDDDIKKIDGELQNRLLKLVEKTGIASEEYSDEQLEAMFAKFIKNNNLSEPVT